MRELEKARDRIGKNTLDAMNWVLRFIQTPLEKLSDGDFSNLRTELYVFSNGAVRQHFAIVQNIGRPGFKTAYCPDKREAKELQEFAQSRIDELFDDCASDFHFGAYRLFVQFNASKTRSRVFPIIKTQKEGFGYYLAHLLGEHAHRLGKCSECQRLFLAVRVHQKFCSPRCRSRAGTREFHKAHSDASKRK